MGARAKLASAAAVIMMLPVMGSVSASAAGGTAPPTPPPTTSHPEYAVCGSPAAGRARCFSHVSRRGGGVAPDTTTSPTGLAPANIKSVYGFSTSSTAGAGQTIAIVDAYDDPTVLNDFNVFNQQFGLTGGGTLTKYVELDSAGNPPATDGGWSLEISLDVQWAHAIAPGANIALIEATDSSYTNLMAAEDYAATLGAKYVSNSWGGSEFCSIFGCETSYDSHFASPGVSYFVASGDSGLPAQYPSASPNVISVGGTTLHFDSTGAFTSETGWSSGGGGCSAVETATSAQSGFSQYPQVGCKGSRATPDVALDADPNSGVSVYDTTPYNNETGWWVVGGTSASTPMWAARSADQAAVVNSSYVYGNNIGFRDITSGNNGASCLTGYDLCSGRGSWLDSGGGGGGGTDPAPTAAFTYTCSGATCSFNGSSSTDADAWAWSGGFSAAGPTTSHTYTTSGSFAEKLTVTDADSGETASATKTVTCAFGKHNRLSCH